MNVYNTKDFISIIYTYNKPKIQTTAMQLLYCLITEFTKDKDPLIRLPLNEYRKLRGLKNTKETRKQVLRDMQELQKIKQEPTQGGVIELYGGTGVIKSGIIFFRVNPDFMEMLKEQN